ncbi:hypothetical protein [Cognatishimia sp. MH4019]|uniref:hypothetical protein n=1 Tax=Cognatishimia sp. MH4019 TaxID=2854030 RepID=UPI001CD7E5A4|nr:hypothetical protein [Cognatishimia sp. MH4019]
MTRIALIAAIAFGAAAPAFAASDLGVTSPAELASMSGFDASFMTSDDLGKTSPAEIAAMGDASDDMISTQSLNALAKLGVTSPAEISARH